MRPDTQPTDSTAATSDHGLVRALISGGVTFGVSLFAHAGVAFGLWVWDGPENVVTFEFDVSEIAMVLPEPRAEVSPPLPEPAPPEPEIAPAPPPVRREREVAPPEPTPEPEVEAPPPEEQPPAPPPEQEIATSPELPSLDEAFGEPGPSILASTNTSGGGQHIGNSLGGNGNGGRLAARPIGPSDSDVRRARREYVRAIQRLLQAAAHYPRAARRPGTRAEGRVELALRVSRDGRLLAVRVVSSSGFDVLDDAAMEAARALSPPAPPGIIPWGAAEEVRAPIVYVLR
jgi:periplasmic protein TonB